MERAAGAGLAEVHELIRVQKLEDDDSHLLIAPAAAPSDHVEPLLTLQFRSGDSLAHVQKLLRDEAFEFAKGLLLENRLYL